MASHGRFSPLRSPRRILIALSIALVLGSGSVGLVGIASADDGQAFHIPARMAGDRFAYDVQFSNGNATFEYSQHQLQPWKDETGIWRVADIQSWDVDFQFFGRDLSFSFWRILDAATFEPLAASHGGGGGASYSSASLPLGLEQNESSSVDTQVLEIGAVGHLCGSVNSMQGAQVKDSFQTIGACGPVKGELIFRFAEETSWQGSTARVYTAVDSPEIRLTFAHDIPYPVRIDLGGLVYTLVGFEPGDTPLGSTGNLPPDTPMPGVGMGAVDRYGVDLGDLGLIYPLVRAVDEARDDPTFAELRDYMDRNPDWIVRTADYEEKDDQQRWNLEFAAPDEGLRLFIQRDAASTRDVALMVPGMEDSALAWDVSYQTSDFAVDGGDGPPIDALPEQLPDPVDVVAAWQTYAETDAAPPMVGFRLPHCGSGVCTGSTVFAGVGTNNIHASASSGFGIEYLTREGTSSEEAGVSLAYDETTALAEIWMISKASQQSAGPLASPQPSEEGSDEEAGPTTAGIGWAPPPGEAAAGITLVSLLVALGYYVWPLAKGLPLVGLWSRRRGGTDLLDHPMRRSLYDHIKSDPGVHYQQLVRQVGRGQGVVEHHLRRLQDGGLVSTVRRDGYVCHFPAGRIDRRAMAAAPALRSDGARAILAAVQATPGASVKDVAQATGLSPGTVTYHLRRLRETGAIESARNGRTVRLHAADWMT